jgi:HSP20 family protein
MTGHRRPRLPVGFLTEMDLPAGAPDGPPLHVPPVDVVDDGGAWRLVFEIPGASSEHLAIEVDGRVVTVRGERTRTDAGSGTFLRVERGAGLFARSLELPEDPEPEGARATLSDGLLVLEIPKRRAKSRSIPIQRTPKGGRTAKDS